MSKFNVGDTVKINLPTEPQFHGETGVVRRNDKPWDYGYEVMLDDEVRHGLYPYGFRETELEAYDPEEREPQPQGEVAELVISMLLSEMVKNRAYEFDGKPIYDGLTSQHIAATLEEFKSRNQFGEKE